MDTKLLQALGIIETKGETLLNYARQKVGTEIKGKVFTQARFNKLERAVKHILEAVPELKQEAEQGETIDGEMRTAILKTAIVCRNATIEQMF